LRPNALEIDADRRARGDRDQRQIGRVRHVELQPAAVFRMQLRFAERAVRKANVGWVHAEVAPQQGPQDTARDDEAPPVTREAKPGAALAFIR